jgi:hypothetical protein
MRWLANLFKRSAPKRYISWYQQPRLDQPREYLARAPDEDEYFYTRDQAAAHRFDTAEEARQPTPTYDGSSGIEERTGILAVDD